MTVAGTTRCADCTYDIPEGANYCPGCGTELILSRLFTAESPAPARPPAAPAQVVAMAAPPSEPVALAGWWRRAGSMMLDTVVVTFPVLMVLGFVLGLTSTTNSNADPNATTSADTQLSFAFYFVVVVVHGAYFTFLTARGDGRTGGNRAAGIAVRDFETGAVLPLRRSFIRWFVRVALYVLVIPGIVNDLWPLWDKRNQTFADKAARSVVIRRSGNAVDPVALPRPPEGDASPPGVRGIVLGLLAFGVGVALDVVVVSALSRTRSLAGDAAALLLGSLSLWTPLVLVPIWLSRRRGTGSLKADYGLEIRRSDFAFGLVGSFVARGASVLVALPLYAAFNDSVKSPQIGRPIDQLRGVAFLAFAFVAVIGAPIVEEFFFRGLIQTRLVGRWGAVKGIAATSVLFGAAHLIGWQGPQSLLAAASIAGGGAVLGYLRNHTGRLGTSMVAHALFNLFVVAIVGFGLLH